jgi:hypothetical protein
MQQAHDFMATRCVPMSLQIKVYRYLETQHDITQGNSISNRRFMAALSPQLQAEMVEELNGYHINLHPFFKNLDNRRALQALSAEASPMIFAATDSIVEKGDTATCAHFLVTGKVRVENPLVHSGKVLYLRPPSWLGDLCLFVDTLRKATVTVVITTETLCLQKSSLLLVCSEYPDVKEKYEAFRQKVQTESYGGLVCPHCKDIGHSEDMCPALDSGSSRWKKNGRRQGTMINSIGFGLRQSKTSNFGSLANGGVAQTKSAKSRVGAASESTSNYGIMSDFSYIGASTSDGKHNLGSSEGSNNSNSEETQCSPCMQ